jgi:hypothetical protein
MRYVAKMILKALGWLLLLPVYFYKYAISPLTPASCRHVPTCSQYAVEAIKVPSLGNSWLRSGSGKRPDQGEKNQVEIVAESWKTESHKSPLGI